MKFATKSDGEVTIDGLTNVGLPALRLVAVHSPALKVGCTSANGHVQVALSEIDLRPSFTLPGPVNSDRAQLAALSSREHG